VVEQVRENTTYEPLREHFAQIRADLAVTRGYILSCLKHWEKLDDQRRRELLSEAEESLHRLTAVMHRLERTLSGVADVIPLERPDEENLRELLIQMKGVRDVKLLIDAEPPQIEVLVVPERDSAETIGKIRSIMTELLGADAATYDLRLVSVEGEGFALSPRRRRLKTVATKRSDDRFAVKVWLELLEDVIQGESQSSQELPAQRRAVAAAVVDAVSSLVEEPVALEDVRLFRSGGVVFASVTLISAGTTLIGAAPLRSDEYDAIARAALDGVNRLMTKPTATL
jgi:hypothetical protein